MAMLRSKFGEYFFVFIVLLVGLVLAGGLSCLYARDSRSESEKIFHAAAADRVEVIRLALENNTLIVRSVASFFEASNEVTQSEFSIFTMPLLKAYPYVVGLGWAPRVDDRQRSAFEKTSLGPEYDNKLLVIKDRAADGILTAAKRRDVYYPVLYTISADQTHFSNIGLDILSDPDRGQALLEARSSGKMSVTSHVMLMKDIPVRDGAVFFMPVKSTVGKVANGREAGFVVAGISFHDLINSAIKPLAYAGVNIVISDLSVSDPDKKILYVRSTRLKDIPRQEILDDFANSETLQDSKTFEVGDKTWQITVLSARGYFKGDGGAMALSIFGAGALFTLLLVLYMIDAIHTNERVTQQVEERTRELSQAQKKTDLILGSTRDGIIGIDRVGTIIFANTMATKITGYSKRELVGQNSHSLLHYAYADGRPMPQEECPIQRMLLDNEPITIDDQVFWSKSGQQLQVEFTAATLMEEDDITGAVIVFRDISERLKAERLLEQMARYDNLTGLANRNLFIDNLNNAIARAERTERLVAVIYMDLNNFKPINDTLGHAAGDKILKEFAQRMRQSVRDYDTPSRFGGDEFTIVCDDLASRQEGLDMISRLLENLQEPLDVGGNAFKLSASIGIAFYPDNAADIDALVSAADNAMYVAKKDKSLKYVVAPVKPA